MTPSHRCYRIALTILVVFVLSGCLARRAEQQFAMSFLPAAIPAPVVAEETSPPAPSLYMSSMPNLAQRTLPQIDWPTEVDSRVLSADHLFEAAKKLYQRGDLEGA